MAFGLNKARSAEQDRQRAMLRFQAQEEASEAGSTAQAPSASALAQAAPAGRPAPSQAPVSSTREARPQRAYGAARPGGGFRPGAPNRPISREQEQAPQSPNVSVAVEDGVSSIQVIRRVLELGAVRKWAHSRVSRLELAAHEDPASVWYEISNDWERLCEERRKAAIHRDDEQICFRIVSGDVARESRPSGPRAANMALLHGLDLVRLSVDRSPFSPEVVAEVAAQQRKLRQEAAQAPAAPVIASQEARSAPEQEDQVAPARPSRFSRQMP